jgi:MinD-like ATPase involved in chromosome partitioning or flagellar assembly
MLLILNTINILKSYLNELLGDNLIDFRLNLTTNMKIDLYLYVKEKNITDIQINSFIESEISLGKESITIIEVNEIDFEGNSYYEWIFKNQINKSKTDLGARKRFTNFLEEFTDLQAKLVDFPFITTFYSYKGGMGRSTTLASFALFCAKLKKKKVVIIDCDFEAPGFTNYYDLDIENLGNVNGIVEYLIDKQFIKEEGKLDIVSNYSYKVGYEYAGEGEIFIIPAGNLSSEITYKDGQLFDSNHRNHYIEALSRLDISSFVNMSEQYIDFISDIKEQLNPDLILFDSRTGINDTFSVLASISQLVVGFFGNNIQTKLGLEQFIDLFIENKLNKNVMIVNSMSSGLEYLDNLKGFVDDYISKKPDFDNLDENQNFISNNIFNIFSIGTDEHLRKLGTDFAYKKQGKFQKYDVNFVNLIENNVFYQPLFDSIFSVIDQKKITSEDTEINDEVIDLKSLDISEVIANSSEKEISEDFGDFLYSNKNKVEKLQLRKDLVEKLYQNTPSQYGENEEPSIENFYFRDCMKDMFHRDKFLIIGSKGTGKTFLYKGLNNQILINELQNRYNLKDEFLFVNMIAMSDSDDKKETDAYLEVHQFFGKGEKESVSEKMTNFSFFERFWKVFLWNSLMLNDKISSSKYFNDEIPVELVIKDSNTLQRFTKYIEDDKIYESIDRILHDLDNKLKEDNVNIIVLFDQLDLMVLPKYWSYVISPLISFWRSNPFTKILPKLFLRYDLFNKLEGIVNIQNLTNRSIEIEWTKKEIFAYFFKTVFNTCKNEFLLLVYEHFDYKNYDFIIDLNEQLINNHNHVPTDEKYLKPIVEVFFGKYANWKNTEVLDGFGESYDWFEKNLADANSRISLRPFLILIKEALNKFIFSSHGVKYSENPKSILSASYFSDGGIREVAVKDYFEDLGKEEGNKPMILFYRTLQEGSKSLKIPVFPDHIFNEILLTIKLNYSDDPGMSSVKSIDDIKKVLINNGVIKESFNRSSTKYEYIIPFFYRSYFKVNAKNNISRK